MVLLKFIEQIVNMFPDVVQRRRDRPLDRLLIADFLWSDLFSLRIIQKFFCGFSDFLYSLLITVFHAICTPSAKIAS